MNHKFFKMTINYPKLLHGNYEAKRLPSDFSPDRIVLNSACNILNPLGIFYCPVVDKNYFANDGNNLYSPYRRTAKDPKINKLL